MASVATKMPAMIGSGRWKRAASTSASSWVLSPISPRATTAVETRKASTGLSGSDAGGPTASAPPSGPGPSGASPMVSPMPRARRRVRHDPERGSSMLTHLPRGEGGYSPKEAAILPSFGRARVLRVRMSPLRRSPVAGTKAPAGHQGGGRRDAAPESEPTLPHPTDPHSAWPSPPTAPTRHPLRRLAPAPATGAFVAAVAGVRSPRCSAMPRSRGRAGAHAARRGRARRRAHRAGVPGQP